MHKFKSIALSSLLLIGLCLIIPSIYAPSHGIMHEHDKKGLPIKLEWIKYSQWSKQIIDLQKQITPIIASASSEGFLTMVKKIQALSEAEKESMDQEDREGLSFFADKQDSKIQEIFEEKFIAQRLSELEAKSGEQEGKEVASPGTEENYLIIAKESNGTILGFVEFNINPEYPSGSIELEPLIITPQAQGRGLARTLIFSILQLNQNVQRIFLGPKKENKKAQAVYEHLGFKKYEECKESIKYEYLVTKKEQIGVCDCPIL